MRWLHKYIALVLLLALAAQAKSRPSAMPRSPLQQVKSISQRRGKAAPVVIASANHDKSHNRVSPFVASLVAGAAAGTAVDLALYPLDTIKTRLQSTATMKWSMGLLSNVYAGVLPGVAASAPASAAFLGAYDSVRAKLATDYRVPFLLGNILAACVGDLAHSVVRAPFEVVKQRVQAGVDVSARTAIKSIYASNGVLGFFSGAAALAMRDLPFDVIEYPVYEYLKAVLARNLKRPLQPWEIALCGFMAGGVAAALTTPLDVVKTRYLTQPKLYNGMIACFQTVLQQEGVRGLFAGMAPRLALIAFGGAIYFGVYETVKQAVSSQGGQHMAPPVTNPPAQTATMPASSVPRANTTTF